jgi:ribosomal protein S18 acetylase RimI-like enzyme
MPKIEVVRTYLGMSEPGAARPAAKPDPRARVERVTGCPASFYRYLYVEVGRNYHWVDRLGWTDDEIRARLASPAVSLFLLTLAGAPAGYFELERHPDDSVEIACFGLLPEFFGRGLGKYLLSQATAAAWALEPGRVWLHTCTLDDPAALPNYLARGFRAFKRETYETELQTASSAGRA